MDDLSDRSKSQLKRIASQLGVSLPLADRIADHIKQTAPHVKERATSKLLIESAERIAALEAEKATFQKYYDEAVKARTALMNENSEFVTRIDRASMKLVEQREHIAELVERVKQLREALTACVNELNYLANPECEGIDGVLSFSLEPARAALAKGRQHEPT